MKHMKLKIGRMNSQEKSQSEQFRNKAFSSDLKGFVNLGTSYIPPVPPIRQKNGGQDFLDNFLCFPNSRPPAGYMRLLTNCNSLLCIKYF